MTLTTADILLKWLLRVIGGVELCAIPFLFFPVEWMNAVHGRMLGLGELPHAPIVEYMARSLTALYALHGALVVRISFDIPRFRPLIRFLGWMHLLLGVVIFLIDLSAGLSWWWVVVEGPGIAFGGALLLFLTSSSANNESDRRNI